MTHKEIEAYIMSFPGVWLDYPFGDGVAVYKVGHKDIPGETEKMFALIAEGSHPLKVSLKCDPQLAVLLREKYDEVQPGYHLNKKHWNTIVCSGQLDEHELHDLIRLSYRLVTE